MDNYREYVNERMERIYESYNSVILEAHKEEDAKRHAKMCKNAFLNYLEYKYDDKDVRYEIKSAKTDKEREAIAKKYAEDFQAWKKQDRTVNMSLIGMIFSGGAAAATGAPIWLIVYFIFFGVILKASNKMEAERDKVGVEKYNKNKK